MSASLCTWGRDLALRCGGAVLVLCTLLGLLAGVSQVRRTSPPLTPVVGAQPEPPEVFAPAEAAPKLVVTPDSEAAPPLQAPHAASWRQLCSDARLAELWARAQVGALSEGEERCLERRYDSDQEARSELSAILVRDGYLKAQHAASSWESELRRREWLGLVRRHRRDLGRDDADLSLLFAETLWRTDATNGAEILPALQDAWDQGTRSWRGRQAVERKLRVWRLRSGVWYVLWRKASERAARNPSARRQQVRDGYRDRLKQVSAEWCDFARATGEPMEAAAAYYASTGARGSRCWRRGGGEVAQAEARPAR